MGLRTTLDRKRDGLSVTLNIYGLDGVGNRTPEPISLTYQLHAGGGSLREGLPSVDEGDPS